MLHAIVRRAEVEERQHPLALLDRDQGHDVDLEGILPVVRELPEQRGDLSAPAEDEDAAGAFRYGRSQGDPRGLWERGPLRRRPAVRDAPRDEDEHVLFVEDGLRAWVEGRQAFGPPEGSEQDGLWPLAAELPEPGADFALRATDVDRISLLEREQLCEGFAQTVLAYALGDDSADDLAG
jgi:hypothetical protein